MKNKNNKKTHVVAGRQNWHFRVVDEIIRRQLWISPKKTCAVIKILEISRRVVWEVVNLKFAIISLGIVETENGACRYAPKSVSTIPDRFSLRHEKLSGIVETWSQSDRKIF